MPLPISSVETAADSMWNWFSIPRSFTIAFMMNSAIGDLQMLPWHTIRILYFFSSLITFHFQVIKLLHFTESIQPKTEENTKNP